MSLWPLRTSIELHCSFFSQLNCANSLISAVAILASGRLAIKEKFLGQTAHIVHLGGQQQRWPRIPPLRVPRKEFLTF